MPLRIKCPTGHSLIVPDDRAGRTLKCPRCGESVLVPGEAVSVAVAVIESPPPAAVDRALVQVAAEPVQAVTVTVAPPKPTPSKQSSPSHKPSPKSPTPPRTVSPAAKPAIVKPAVVKSAVVKPKSRVLPVPPPQTASPPPPPAAAEPAPPSPPPPAPPAPTPVGEVTLPLIAETPPIVETPAAMEAANEPSAESPPAPSPPPDPAISQPPSAHNSSDDIAAFLKLQFADQPVPSAPVRPSAAVIRDTHDADVSRTLAVYQLAAALAVAALFSVAPAVWDLVEYIRIDEFGAPFVARWALILFFVGIVQLAYAVFLFQLPDWASVWVVTLFQLALAAAYAAVLGIVLMSDTGGLLVGPQGLQLSDKLAGGQAALWCLCMVSVATILAFFAGRMSVRWRQAERMLQSVQFGSAH